MPRLNVILHPGPNCDVYFKGQEPGDTDDPRCNDLENRIMDHVDDLYNSGIDLNNEEELLRFMKESAEDVFNTDDIYVGIR